MCVSGIPQVPFCHPLIECTTLFSLFLSPSIFSLHAQTKNFILVFPILAIFANSVFLPLPIGGS